MVLFVPVLTTHHRRGVLSREHAEMFRIPPAPSSGRRIREMLLTIRSDNDPTLAVAAADGSTRTTNAIQRGTFFAARPDEL